MTSAERTRVALVGLGRAGHFHLQSVVELPNLCFAVCLGIWSRSKIAAQLGHGRFAVHPCSHLFVSASQGIATRHMVQLAWVVDIDEEKAQRIAKEQGCRWSTQVGVVI